MKFTNVFSVGLVAASAFTVTTALPIATNDVAAREANVLALARSIQELDARDPFDWGGLFNALKPIAKPYVAKIPKVGGFLSQFFRRDGTIDEDLVEDFALAAYLNKVQARDMPELSARDPFDWGALFNAVKPIAKPYVAKIPKIGGFLSQFFRRDGSVDEDAVGAFADAVLEDLASENSVVARSFSELNEREPFTIPPALIATVIKNGPAIIKAVAPVAKKAIKSVKKFFKKLFRRDDLTDDDVANIIADYLKPSISARDVNDSEWEEFVQAIKDASR